MRYPVSPQIEHELAMSKAQKMVIADEEMRVDHQNNPLIPENVNDC